MIRGTEIFLVDFRVRVTGTLSLTRLGEPTKCHISGHLAPLSLLGTPLATVAPSPVHPPFSLVDSTYQKRRASSAS